MGRPDSNADQSCECGKPVYAKGRCHKCYLREHHREYMRRPKSRAMAAARMRRWRAAHPRRGDLYKRGNLYRYKMPLCEFKRMVDEQGNRCVICTRKMERPCVDHDHRTGKVRGLLCPRCNGGLGQFQDSTALLAAATRYLEDHRSAGSISLSGGEPAP